MVFVVLAITFAFLSIAPALFLTENYALWRGNWWSAIPLALFALIGMLLLPLLVIRKFFKEDLREYGFRLPEDYRETLILVFLAIVLFLPLLFFFGGEDSFQGYYSAVAELTLGKFLVVGVLASLIYYVAEEFLFRGFLFWGLWQRAGYHSFWINGVIFASLHLTKPFAEVVFAFFASLIFCFLSLKTKSFLSAAAVHFAIALIFNILIILFSKESGQIGDFFYF